MTRLAFLSQRIVALLIVVLPVFAQTDRGLISGTVVDSSGAVIARARITAVHAETNVSSSTQSTDSGVYTIPALPAGTYRVTAVQTGFKSFTRNGVVVPSGGDVRVDVTLEVGSVAESVMVTGTAEQLQTNNARITSQVDNRMVDELPLVVSGSMRNAIDLALITPEARQDNGTGVSSDNTFALGGGQVAAWGISLDGISANIARYSSVSLVSVNTPSLDAITEFTVDTNGFKAEYGRASGGNMSFSSKSGTNALHGTAYEFIRNDAFDARRFFEAERGSYKQHDFGFSAGGPVWVPKVYNGKNRTFFFAAGEWFRNRVGASSQFLSVPTPEMYQGDFRNWVDGNGKLSVIYDPTTTRTNAGGGQIRDPFPGNMVPQDRFANFSKAVLKQVGTLTLPNSKAAPGTSDYVRNNYVDTIGAITEPWNKTSAKLDHNLTTNDRVSFLYHFGQHLIQPGPRGFPGMPGFLNSTNQEEYTTNSYRATYTKVIRPTIVNYMYGGYNGLSSNKKVLAATGGWKAKGVCLINAWDCDVNFPQIDFSDYNTWGGTADNGAENLVFSFGDDLTVTRGRHTIKTGYLWERLHYNGIGQQSVSGLIRGDRRSTSIPGNNTLATGGGNGFASFLLGEAFSGGTENYRLIGQQFRSHAWYVQDDWRVSSRLTLNPGVRYEFTLPPLEQQDRWADFTPAKPNPGADGHPGALRFAGFGEGRENSRTLIDGWYGGISPRLGAAYSLDSKTVVRASAARSFGVVKTVTGSTHFDGSVIIFRPSSTDNGVTPAFRLDHGLPAYIRPPSTNPAFSNGNNVPYWNNEGARLPESYDWTFSVQRQMASNLVFEAQYNATVGAHLVAGLQSQNQVAFSAFQKYGLALLQSNIDSAAARAAGLGRPYPSFTGSVAQALRPFPQYLNIDTAAGNGDRSGHSSYHAMVLKLDKRFAQGFSVLASYVLSKLMTDADSYNVDNTALDQYNRRLDKSIGQYDQTHNFKVSYVWELPLLKKNRWLGGWRVAGIQSVTSGTPLDLANNNVYNIFNGRSAIYVTSYDGWNANKDSPNWLGSDRFFQSRSAFGTQPADRLGNSTRHNPKARTFPSYVTNVSLAKAFPIRERIHVDFRAEAFNLMNNPRFATGSRNIDDPNFGVVRAQLNEPRRMQFALKFYY
jgi:Carboxypeptidase regulatory-like domain